MNNDGIIYYIVYPESHEHLGLFIDLKEIDNVKLIPVKRKFLKNRILKGIRKLHTSWTINKRIKLPFQKIWYINDNITISDQLNYCVVFVDAAIEMFNKKELIGYCASDKTRCVLVCINSIDASSIGMLKIKDKIFKIPWNDVYSFDPVDCEKYGLKDIRNCYYSMQEVENANINYDAYYIGSLKGGRKQFIVDCFAYMYSHGVNALFELSVRKEEMIGGLPFENIIHYHNGSWMPYIDVLRRVSECNVIFEILQQGQHGPSLRYYEAVCYNKKLITTNSCASQLPYFNPDYMKIITNPEDIDIDWVKDRLPIDYGYTDDFSPIHMLDVVMD